MKDKILSSTISNYILLILKIILSIMLVRIMFLGISNEEYGFWALLWSVFGYSLLLDFGFGTAVQKATSVSNAKNDWKGFNETISTIFFSYIFLSSIILIVTIILAKNLDEIFVFSGENTSEYYKTVFYIFGIGTSLLFPFGFFREILRGLEKITIRNNIDIVFLILNFVLLTLCINYSYSLIHMALVAILLQLFTNIFMAYYVIKNIPDFKISYRFFKKQRVYSLMSFSIFAYIVMFSNVIIFRTDQLVISMFSTVALVGIYQIVSRVSELFRQFSTQIHDILGPISASLFVTNEHDKLYNTLFQTNKIVGIISTILFIPSFLFIDKLLYFWLDISNDEVTYTAMILLVSMYILVFFRSSSVQVLLMCNKHKQLTVVAVIEAIMNLVLSIYLVQKYSIIGVALGTLIPNLFFAIFYNIPVSCSFSKVSISYYLKEVVIKILSIATIVFVCLYVFINTTTITNLYEVVVYGILSVLSFSFLYYFLCLNESDKEKIFKLFLNKRKVI
jgi:O-antigen/teichoic acid export membrane protein